MKDKLESYIALLTRYTELCGNLLLHERKKREALLGNNLIEIENVLQIQQALIMKLKNFERKRMALQAELGFPDMTAEEMLSSIGNEDSKEVKQLRSVFKELRTIAIQIKEYNRISIEFTKKNLDFIELMMQSGDGAAAGVYHPGVRNKEGRYNPSIEKTV